MTKYEVDEVIAKAMCDMLHAEDYKPWFRVWNLAFVAGALYYKQQIMKRCFLAYPSGRPVIYSDQLPPIPDAEKVYEESY
jgi:hypothetical protein